jgi:hypothetical protein
MANTEDQDVASYFFEQTSTIDILILISTSSLVKQTNVDVALASL